MPSGSKMRSWRNSSNGFPDATSTTRPACRSRRGRCSASVDPGWKSSGTPANRATYVWPASPPASPGQSPVRHLPRPDPAAAQAGRVRHQVADRDLALGRDELDLAVLLDGDLQPLELGDELRDRVGQPDLALLDQHHDGDARHRLGGGGHAEEARPWSWACFDSTSVRPWASKWTTCPLRATSVTAPGDVVLVDVALHDLVDPMQPLRRDPDLLRLGPGQLPRLARPRRQEGPGQEDEE